jgi:hypothetical protein
MTKVDTSSERAVHNMRRHDARELLVEPLRFEGKPLVVKAEQMQNRRAQVADTDRILGRIAPQIVDPYLSRHLLQCTQFLPPIAASIVTKYLSE